MPARRSVLAASLLLLAALPAVAQSDAPMTTPAPEAVRPKVVTPGPLDKAALARACAEQSEARGLHGKTKLRWQVKCRKGKIRH